jgi:hypothetical protein
MSKATFLLAGVLFAMAAPARAGWVVQGIPGATCSTDQRSFGTWEYRGQKLLNTDSDPWGIVVVTCPVSVFAPGVQPREYRISLNDPERRAAWCDVYSHNGTLVRTHWTDEGIPAGSLGSPLGWSVGLAEMTVHCLLFNGASLDRIELVWWKP